MPNHDLAALSLQLKDFLSAFGLDHANIKDISISHDDSNSLCVYVELNIHEHFCLFVMPLPLRSKAIN